MSVMRTAKQVAFNDLLVALEESVDKYADLGNSLHDPAVAEAFQGFTQERQSILRRLEADIRRMDDLPSVPDADREDLGKLVNRLRAALSADEITQALQKMLDAEQHIAGLVEICRREELDPLEARLLDDLDVQLDSTRSRLRQMAAESARQP